MAEYIKKAPSQKAEDMTAVEETARRMLADIKENGDAAVARYASELDKWQGGEFRVTEYQIAAAEASLPETFKEDFEFCHRQITQFAGRQLETLTEFECETQPGIVLGQKQIPVSNVGCYIPGGKYPLVAAASMSVGVARAAGVEHIIGCAPPRDGKEMYAPTLYALHTAGADEIYALGGIQAMAAMAYGCVGMRAVDLITGPGNAYVAEAKRQLYGTVGIDLLAGPTEILIIADDTADPELVATDLLGQAEHGPDSPAWLVTTSRRVAEAALVHVEEQLKTLPTKEIAGPAWRDHGEIAVVSDIDEAIRLSDEYAPEHLELMTGSDDEYLSRLKNYGSLFVGEEATVAYGDKGIGTNHTLPTNGASRYTGGLWVGKFIKTVTYQRLKPAASRAIAPVLARQCEVEGMLAHGITCDVRFARYEGANE
ncbi:MAG: histidinol dehydrogenase [Alphaproteobacteria bacterium]